MDQQLECLIYTAKVPYSVKASSLSQPGIGRVHPLDLYTISKQMDVLMHAVLELVASCLQQFCWWDNGGDQINLIKLWNPEMAMQLMMKGRCSLAAAEL